MKGQDIVKDIGNIEPAITADGQKISLYASISSIKEFNIAKGINFDGIGLVRTEALFINYAKVPDEKKQFSIYSRMAKAMDKRLVVLRTVDIGGDKVPGSLDLNTESSKNVSRGIRRSLEHKDELAVQMRSIIRAIAYGNVCITFPMVNSVEEIREVKEIIRGIEAEPSIKDDRNIMKIKIGAFVETIPAVNDIDNIIKEADFINLGTNDLLHQFCGLNRKCSVIEKENYLDPEFIKMVKLCVDRANAHNKPVIICGEMASDPMTVAVLLGLGIRELSITPGAFADIYNVIRKVSYDEAAQITERAIQSKGIGEVKKILSDWISRM
ncbi:MAG: Phosphoenolpyruvate-protein phosphotransferase [Firmicutes bacterium ADurb.Bin419]|nr:MAG: Phosphoenolpyruvate-protein phosphotransferase [Firmicutes bacterium ADurb.Bin419]